MNKITAIAVLVFLQVPFVAGGKDFAALCTDRAAVERVYYNHRLGEKLPFEKAMPRETIEQLVRQAQHKDAVLTQVYGVQITPAMIAAEVQRIDTTTRAPETLAEIKHALGDDAERFALTMARPILVERELRRHFDNDARLHAAQRRKAEQARENLLAGKPVENMHDVTWQLTPRLAPDKSAISAPLPTLNPPPSTTSSSAYTVEATAQLSQVIASPDHAGPGTDTRYFEDLDSELQQVLLVQLQTPGNVSAVIETPNSFLVFLATGKTAGTLTAKSLSVPKRSYEEWLAQQADDKA